MIFLERFTPPEATGRLCDEFSYLIQGDMTIPEYHKKFNELSHFAPHLIQNLKRKNLRFINGLQRKYQNKVLGHVKLPFPEMIYMAYQYEDLHKKGMLRDEEEVCSSDKEKSETDIPEASKKPSAKRKRARSEKEPGTTAICKNCNQRGHLSRKCKSLKKPIKDGYRANQKQKKKRLGKDGEFQENRHCKQCREAGHLAKDCPLLNKVEAVHVNELAKTSEPSASQERADVLEGTLTVKNIPVKVLFDTGGS